MNNKDFNLDRTIDRLCDGSIDRKEFSELEARLLADPELRRQFRARMRLDANLRAQLEKAPSDILPQMMSPSPRSPKAWRSAVALAGMAAALAIGAFFVLLTQDPAGPESVATIVSEEGAAWSTRGLVGEGAELVPGIMHLERGIASLRFKSGAVADLEAPVTIELLDPMRCRLSRGKAVFDVPESAIGFVVETPNGYAVDHGTRFAVALQNGSEEVKFGVLSGRISVHHGESQAQADVNTGDMVLLSASGIGNTDNAEAPAVRQATGAEVLRFRTNGRETSIVHGDIRELYLEPGLLMVKRDMPLEDENQDNRVLWPKDRRSLIAFEVDGLDGKKIEKVTLRLNLVPSERGYANLLPERTRIEVYGILDRPELESWSNEGLKWADAPGSMGEAIELDTSEVSLLGSFEIPRSRFEGPVTFESPEFTRFVNQDRSGVVGLLLVSASMPQDYWAMVHAFASSQHLEAAGPLLEVKVKSPENRPEAYAGTKSR